MDNLTHSLVGVAFARALPKRMRRPEIYWASVLGSNAPDSDVIVRLWPGADALDYLVHHRGITHTFALAPAMGLLSAFFALRIARGSKWRLDLVAVAILASLLHVGADFLNSYGVHPFSPFSDRWYYGDAVFIVEPLIWFALIPFIARAAERRWARAGWWVLLIPMLVLIWRFPLYSTPLSAAVTAFAGLSAIFAVLLKTGSARAFTAISLLTLALTSFAIGGNGAQKIARGYWQSATEGTETLLDAASTPLPSNPLCWSVWIASRTSEDYRMRSAVVSLWPSRIANEACVPFSRSERTADVRPSTFAAGAAIRWDGEARIGFGEWNDLRKKSPTFRRFLAFARFPYIKRFSGGRTIVGDLRYDREPGLGFSEFEIPENEENTPGEGPWEPPFRDH